LKAGFEGIARGVVSVSFLPIVTRFSSPLEKRLKQRQRQVRAQALIGCNCAKRTFEEEEVGTVKEVVRRRRMDTKTFTAEEKKQVFNKALELHNVLSEIQNNGNCLMMILILLGCIFDLIFIIIWGIGLFVIRQVLDLISCPKRLAEMTKGAIANADKDENAFAIANLELQVVLAENKMALGRFIDMKPPSFTEMAARLFNRSRYRKTEQLRQEISELVKLPETIHVVDTVSFLRREDPPQYTEVRTDDIKALKGVTFLSHKWYGQDPHGEGKLQASLTSFTSTNMVTRKIWVDYLCAQNSLVNIVLAISLIPKMNVAVHYGPSKQAYNSSMWCMLERTIFSAVNPYGNKDPEKMNIFDPEDMWIMLYSLCIVPCTTQVAKRSQLTFLQLLLKKMIMSGLVDEHKDLLPLL
jgi:hypothetical protein